MAIKMKHNGEWVSAALDVDQDLIESGKAADAKAVGEKMKELEEVFELLQGKENSLSQKIENIATEIQPIERGGTGSSDGADGLANLLRSGPTVLSSNQCGKILPTEPAPKDGTLFFREAVHGIDDVADSLISELMLRVYPIGSFYISTSPALPSTLFGGEWEQVKDKFLVATGDIYSEGVTINEQNLGTGTSFNFPPYLVVYMWKRTG